MTNFNGITPKAIELLSETALTILRHFMKNIRKN